MAENTKQAVLKSDKGKAAPVDVEEKVLQPQEEKPQLIVIFKPEFHVKVTQEGLEALDADVSPVQALLEQHNASLKLLFGQDEDRLRSQQEEVFATAPSEARSPGEAEDSQGGTIPDMASFFHVDGPVKDLEQLANDLRAQEYVEAAYFSPSGSLPQYIAFDVPDRNAPPATPTFVPRQSYLNPAPAGIDAIFAHTFPGGKGDGLKIIDCEWGWRFTHEDLSVNQGGVVAGTNSTDVSFVNHGTAVAGVVSGDANFHGITGIAPNAIFSASSFVGQSVGAAIKAAADKLRIGDVILLEIHAAGPNAPNPPQGQKGYIAIEWWPDALVAIRYAVAKGIVVVEAAGNGGENLDAAIYNNRPSGFPPWWQNPFNVQNPSSGGILVGAGCPPPGTHDRNHGPDRSRLDFSNWGARVDCQGWGREVTSTGYGDLQGGVNHDLWYTDRFSGTSSASPIVTGAVLVAQGIRKSAGRRLLTSPQFRSLLQSTGSQQQPSPIAPVTQRIGNRPDLRRLIPAAMNLA